MSGIRIIPGDYIARYELEIARRGCCDALAEICFTEDKTQYSIMLKGNNYCEAGDLFERSRGRMFDGYRLLLGYLRTICKGVMEIEDYLIPASHISFIYEDILICGDHPVFQFSGSEKDFRSAIYELLDFIKQKYPDVHADFLISKLPASCNAHELYKILTSMEIDLSIL